MADSDLLTLGQGQIIAERSKQYSDTKNVTVQQLSTPTEGFAQSYIVKQNNAQVGVTINIPKDFLVRSAEVYEVTEADVPVEGYTVGEKYIDFVVNTVDGTGNVSHIYLLTTELMSAISAGNGISISLTNEISVKVASTGANGLSVTSDGLKLAPAVATVTTITFVQATGTYVDGTTYYTDSSGTTEVDTSTFIDGVTDVSSYYVSQETVTVGSPGAMSTADKTKLDALRSDATAVSVPNAPDGTIIINGVPATVVEMERLWSKFEANTVYSEGAVFRTPTTPSWGYWQVTTAGTSGDADTVPSGVLEYATATSGTMECMLMRIGSGGGSSGGIVGIARAWAMGENSPDGDVDADSPTGYTQSSKTWAETSKAREQTAQAWAMSATSPDGETDNDSPTGETQSSKTWALMAKANGIAAEEYAEQTASQVETTAWNSTTTYNYPTVVHYTDGYSYRCVGANVVGERPGISQNWVCLSRVTSATWEYDTDGGVMPVINPIGDSNWELDLSGALMPTTA